MSVLNTATVINELGTCIEPRKKVNEKIVKKLKAGERVRVHMAQGRLTLIDLPLQHGHLLSDLLEPDQALKVKMMKQVERFNRRKPAFLSFT